MRKNTILCVLIGGGLAVLTRPGLQAQSAPTHQLLAVAQADNALAIFTIDGRTLSLASKVPVGKGAREVCVSPDGTRAYVPNGTDNTITAIDLGAQQAIATITPPEMKRPDGCTVSPDSKKVYVTGFDSDDVAIISTATNQVVKHLTTLPKEPRRVMFTPDARQYYVSTEEGNAIVIFDAATDARTSQFPSGGHAPRTMLLLPDHKTLLVTNVDDDSVSFLDPGTKAVNLTIGAGGSPQRLAVSRDGAWGFVLSVLEEKISIIDLKGAHVRAKKFVTVGHAPYGMTMTDDASLLFVSNVKDNEIAAYDTAALAALPNAPRAQVEPATKVTLNTPYGLAIR